MNLANFQKAETIRRGTLDYLRSRGYFGMLDWHPLYMAVRELYCFLLEDKCDS